MSWRYKIVTGDCLEALKKGRPKKIDAVVCDPPAGIDFMGKGWDSARGGLEPWVEWLAERLRECYRVLKPGGYMLVWAYPRTSHWTGLAIHYAGFEIRDRVSHLFGTGFPKGGMVSKSIDKKLGFKPTVVGENPNHRPVSGVEYEGVYAGGNTGSKHLTTPTSPEAKLWDGWASNLKPACEDWWLARKPFKGTLVANVLEQGTGALNVDACRVPTADKLERKLGKTTESASGWKSVNRSEIAGKDGGRWPANVVLSHHPLCGVECCSECPIGILNEQSGVTKSGAMKRTVGAYEGESVTGFLRGDSGPHNQHGDEGGAARFFTTMECHPDCPIRQLDEQSGVLTSGERKAGTLNGEIGYHKGGSQPANEQHYEADSGGASRFYHKCHPDCAVRQLDEQSGELYSASAAYYTRGGKNSWPGETEENLPTGLDAKGGASRFYYCAKPGKKERNAGLSEGEVNKHPTVKSVELMKWLIRLVTPPNGIVLDPFMGSGTTGVACMEEGFRFVGIELEEDSSRVAQARIARAHARAREEENDEAEADEGRSGEPERGGAVGTDAEGVASEKG